MNLSELIYKRLTENSELTNKLAVFAGKPAVFSIEPPDDENALWEGKQYPKVVFNFDMLANEKRQSSGTLTVVLLCKNSADVMPEAIEWEIVKTLCDVLLLPDTGIPYCFAWSSTEGFSVDEKSHDMTIGSEIRFDILDFPSQITTDPDPIAGVNPYLKGIYPESIIIGHDKLNEITEITKQNPVLYARLVETRNTETSYTVAWMECKIAIHVICPNPEVRLKMAGGISTCMVSDSRLKLQDNSPMNIEYTRLSNTSDYLKSGQLEFTGKYGVLRYQPLERPLRNINDELREKGGSNGY